jgi:aspartokinase
MISQGGSQWNLSVVVAEVDVLQAVRLLHNEFFRELDPAVFE